MKITVKQNYKKLILLLMTLFLLAAASPMQAYAVTAKTVKKHGYTTRTATAKSYSRKVERGVTYKLKVQKGYLRFTAPKDGTYLFTFSELTQGVSGTTGGERFGYIRLMTTQKSAPDHITQRKVTTKGGKDTLLCLATSEYYNENVKGETITTRSYLPSRQGKIKLTKGQVVYIYMNFGSKVYDTVKLKITRKK